MLRFVLSRINGHISHVFEDSKEANRILKSDAKFLYSTMYLSNTVETDFFNIEDISKKSNINILVGNSTDPTNNHLGIFDIIQSQLKEINKIYCPLSYGDYEVYKNEIIEEGYRRFGDKFVPLTNFMSLEKYVDFLKNIDVAIFNHNRQQAMGNTLTLLSLGKIVYMKSGTNSFKSLNKRKFRIFDVKLIEKNGIKKNYNVIDNKELLNKFYSKNILIESYLNL
jgi:hypothetical protein